MILCSAKYFELFASPKHNVLQFISTPKRHSQRVSRLRVEHMQRKKKKKKKTNTKNESIHTAEFELIAENRRRQLDNHRAEAHKVPTLKSI